MLNLFDLDLICLSHLRWNFVYQRPQHLLSRAAQNQRVFFIEEPVFDAEQPSLKLEQTAHGVFVAVPHLPASYSGEDVVAAQKHLLAELTLDQGMEHFMLWYYTPMALRFTRHLRPELRVYDCMDQLSHFKDAPSELAFLERELFGQTDIVFTGGQSLYEDKRMQHPNVHAFPSSVDVAHFAKARRTALDPEDQAGLPHPRFGYAGVIDERMDLDLIATVAEMRPDWHFIMIGPVVKISPASLPRRPNIHYLGGKDYTQLPNYMASWDVAILPFARNAATKFISPTKTPEYLAAGKRVIATSIRDIARFYGEQGLVSIADTPTDFVHRGEEVLKDADGYTSWLARVDSFLAGLSWDKTYKAMTRLIQDTYSAQQLQQLHPLPQLQDKDLRELKSGRVLQSRLPGFLRATVHVAPP